MSETVLELAKAVLDDPRRFALLTVPEAMRMAIWITEQAKAVTMVGLKSRPTDFPATVLAVGARHLYVMDKNGFWFHFEPKDASPHAAGEREEKK